MEAVFCERLPPLMWAVFQRTDGDDCFHLVREVGCLIQSHCRGCTLVEDGRHALVVTAVLARHGHNPNVIQAR